MATYRYSKSHEYIREENGAYYLGISTHAQAELGDITYVEAPAIGAEFAKGDVCCTVESVKAVAEVYAPVGFKIVAANADLENTPELVNQDAQGKGWIIQIELLNPAELNDLMDQTAYDGFAK